jgi:hypothetical protein
VVWEIAVELSDSGKTNVFRIAGSRATELRMLSVADKRSSSCAEVEGPDGISGIGAKLPW